MQSRIVLSGVNLVEMGPLSIFQDALESLAAEHSANYEIVALVHRRDLFKIPNVTYIEFPKVKTSWFRRLQFEFWTSRNLSLKLRPFLWLSMHDITPNVIAPMRAVYCHNPAPFYRFRTAEARADWKFGLFTLFYKLLYRINIHSNQLVVVQQQWMRREFKRLYDVQNVVVAHPTISASAHVGAIEPSGTATPNYKFLFPSYPRVFKNVEACLKAARILERRGFNQFELWLTFDGSVNKYAASIVKQFLDLRQVRWHGLVPRSRVFELYAAADCLLFPSRLETWGLPITEFRSFGKPVLVADLPYAHETASGYDQTAFFNPDNPEELARLMLRAALGEPVFHKAEEIPIEEPFVRNWSQLWSLLLPGLGTSGAAEHT